MFGVLALATNEQEGPRRDPRSFEHFIDRRPIGNESLRPRVRRIFLQTVFR